MTEESIAVPASLGDRGGALWSALHEKYEFEAKEDELLLEACRSLDVIDALEVVVAADGRMITGSTGQKILHPAIAEVRMQQASFARLVGLLNLPEDVAAGDRFRFERAKSGASARWEGPLRTVGRG